MGARQCLGACALILTVSAAHAADRGFYFGASGGQAKYDFNLPEPPVAVIGFLPPIAGFVPDPTFDFRPDPGAPVFIAPAPGTAFVAARPALWLPGDDEEGTVFTVADGIVWLYQAVDRNSVVRKLQVQKMRGHEQIPGLHTMRITREGVTVFPRLLKPNQSAGSGRPLNDRVSTGVPVLDEMTSGGIPRGFATLLVGPSGSGKTILSNQFILEGASRGEPGVIAVFEKRPTDYLQTSGHEGVFARLIQEGKLEILYLRPLDLSIDETLTALRDAVLRIGAKRAVIDSLSGLELALAPTFREDFRESLYRMVGALSDMGVTIMSTVELPDSFTELQFSPHGIAFLNDAIIMQRYLEVGGQLKRVIGVVKLRGSQHSKDLREYEISADGLLVVGEPLRGYEGLLTGAPKDVDQRAALGPAKGSR